MRMSTSRPPRVIKTFWETRIRNLKVSKEVTNSRTMIMEALGKTPQMHNLWG